jgi:carboxypeptidase Taq
MEAAMIGPYDELIAHARETWLLGTTTQLLRWDQETMLPPGGIEHRSRQLEQLAGLMHERATAPRVGELLAVCEDDAALTSDAASDAAVNLRELRYAYDRATKLPAALVTEKARVRALAQRAWVEARQRSDFSIFRPFLDMQLTLARRTAECVGWPASGEPWDALADDYERGMTAAGVATVFAPLRETLQALAADLMSGPKRPSRAFLDLRLPLDAQQAFVRHVAARIGFDFSRGRLDVSAHPFNTGQHPGDVRITARYKEQDVGDALGAVMHEAGHAIYDQGLRREHSGTPLGRPASLGIHESQSRMWENQVGRSEAFWRWCAGELGTFFGTAVAGLSFDDVYGGMNLVGPTFIRVEADEVTYNLHVMVRFELERALLSGALDTGAVPQEWNRRYQEYLGVEVPDDAQGCLQDIHWSMGAFGYFPTYTLGNLYGAQLFEQALADMPGLCDGFAAGDFTGLKEWLNRNVHAHGARYHAGELCERVTGRPLSAEPLLRHLEGKLRPLYGV